MAAELHMVNVDFSPIAIEALTLPCFELVSVF